MDIKKIESKLYNNKLLITYCGALLLITVVLMMPTILNYFQKAKWVIDETTSFFLLFTFLGYYVINFVIILIIDNKRTVLKLNILQIIVLMLIIFDLVLIL